MRKLSCMRASGAARTQVELHAGELCCVCMHTGQPLVGPSSKQATAYSSGLQPGIGDPCSKKMECNERERLPKFGFREGLAVCSDIQVSF